MDNLILFDFSNLAHRCIYLKQIEAASENPEYALWHYMVFQAMYDYVIQTAEDFGGTFDVVLALDSHSSYWRKDIYHPYKGDRLVKKAIDGLDWARIYEEFDVLTRNIRECLPWKVISAPKCEADDVIYTLTQQHLLEHPEGRFSYTVGILTICNSCRPEYSSTIRQSRNTPRFPMTPV